MDIFSGRVTSRNKNISRGYGGMLPQKCFENLSSVLVILVLFVQLVRKILSKIFTPNFESFTKYDAMMRLVHIFPFMLAMRKDYAIEEVQNYGKLVFIKDIVEKCLVGVCIPLMPPSIVDQLLFIPSRN